jgi:hypothetical protein
MQNSYATINLIEVGVANKSMTGPLTYSDKIHHEILSLTL